MQEINIKKCPRVYTPYKVMWCCSSKKGYLGYQKRTVCLMSVYASEAVIVAKVWVYKSLQLRRNKYVVGFCISVLLLIWNFN